MSYIYDNPNPLGKKVGDCVIRALSRALGGFMNFKNQFNQFQQNVANQGINPQQKVQELLNSGQMSQQQFEQLRQIANQITGQNN